jgi:hypothetical protein
MVQIQSAFTYGFLFVAAVVAVPQRGKQTAQQQAAKIPQVRDSDLNQDGS